MITNDNSWSLGATPNKSLDSFALFICSHFQGDLSVSCRFPSGGALAFRASVLDWFSPLQLFHHQPPGPRLVVQNTSRCSAIGLGCNSDPVPGAKFRCSCTWPQIRNQKPETRNQK